MSCTMLLGTMLKNGVQCLYSVGNLGTNESNQKVDTNILVAKGTPHTRLKVHIKAMVVSLASFNIGKKRKKKKTGNSNAMQ